MSFFISYDAHVLSVDVGNIDSHVEKAYILFCQFEIRACMFPRNSIARHGATLERFGKYILIIER